MWMEFNCLLRAFEIYYYWNYWSMILGGIHETPGVSIIIYRFLCIRDVADTNSKVISRSRFSKKALQKLESKQPLFWEHS